MKNTTAGAPTPARYIVHAVWHKLPDLQVHAREVVIDGTMIVLELRDYIVSTGEYGRGVWFANGVEARDLIDAVTLAPVGGAQGPVPPVGPAVLASAPKAPGSQVHLRAIDIDGTTVLEFREHRGGVDLRGYWIPFDAKAERILAVVGGPASMKAVS